MEKPLLINQLPVSVQLQAQTIASREGMNPSLLTFEPSDDSNYFRMLEAGIETGYGYYIQEQEID